MWLLLFLLLISVTSSPPRCAIQAQPRLSIAPLRYVRLHATIDRNDAHRDARLSLVDEDGVAVRASEFQTDDVRTHWVEWRSLALPAGAYRATLEVLDGSARVVCRASQDLLVGGGAGQ